MSRTLLENIEAVTRTGDCDFCGCVELRVYPQPNIIEDKNHEDYDTRICDRCLHYWFFNLCNIQPHEYYNNYEIIKNSTRQPDPIISRDPCECCSSEYTLYRHFDEHGNLLYVGRTNSPPKRIRGHKVSSEWWDQVKSMTFEHYPDFSALCLAEKEAIQSERPRYNRHHNR